MARIISFASGSLWQWSRAQNRNNLISYARKLRVDGIEITFSSKKDLYKFRLSKNNERWLRSLDYITIHAPFDLAKSADNKQEMVKQLKIIAELCARVNAKAVIIHPRDLPEPRVLNKFNFEVLTENLPKKKKVTISELRKIFKKYPKIGLCLDVSHAYRWSKYETRRLIRAFQEKIAQIHFSGTYRKRNHQSLRKVSKNFMFSIRLYSS